MAQIRPLRVRTLRDRLLGTVDDGVSPLWKCVGYSGAVHLAFIWALWIVPHLPLRAPPPFPVYTVDLVGGEKLGGTNLGTERPPPQPKRAKPEPPPPVEPVKKEPPKVEAAKKAEVVVKEPPKVEAPKKEITKLAEKPTPLEDIMKAEKPKVKTKEKAPAAESLAQNVREKLIEAALQRVRERTEAVKPAEKEPISSGPAEGVGAASVGPVGTGGGIVKAFEFIVYRNQMLRVIRDRWTWVGRRSDLEVTVKFGIQENGQIVGLRIVRASGDPSYDESVLRAVTKASPLSPPPENYRREFMDVELTFRPKDLGG